jgi:hypothetical protein
MASPDETEPADMVLPINTVIVRASRWRGQDADSLVIPDRNDLDPRLF